MNAIRRSQLPHVARRGSLAKPVLGILLAAGVLTLGVAGGRWLRNRNSPGVLTPSPHAVNAPAGVSRGTVLYQVYCAKCHGPQGRGDGQGIPAGSPPPRDFAAAKWRFEKTPESIQRVIRDGIQGTSMPAAGKALSTDDARLLADLVLELAARAPQSADEPAEAAGDPLVLAGFVRADGQPAPGFAVKQVGGDVSTQDSYRGSHLLIHFWGTTCTHCLAELARVEELSARLKPGSLRVVSVCIDDDDEDAVRQLGDEFAKGHPLYIDESGLMNHRFSIQSLPTYVLIDPRGNIIGRQTGSREWTASRIEKLAEYLQQAVPPRPPG